MKHAIIAALIVVASTAAVKSQTYVRDGDTIVADGTPVRLKGLSCAETSTQLGKFQKDVLIDLMNDAHEVNCMFTGEQSYDRQVGWCSLDNIDIGAYMIETANCQPCRRYDTTGKYSQYPVTGKVPNYCKD